MWIATTHGFYSVVTTGPEIQIRARHRRDLENLQRMMTNTDRRIRFDIISTPKADYPYRAIVTHTAWRRILERLAYTVVYKNFKNHIAATPDQRDKHDAYAALWSALHALQHYGPPRRLAEMRVRDLFDKPFQPTIDDAGWPFDTQPQEEQR